MAGSITLNQPGGAGILTGSNTVITGYTAFPTFVGATTTTYTWALTAPATSIAVMKNSTTTTPSFPVDVDGHYRVTFTDSNGTVYYFGFSSVSNPGGEPEAEVFYNVP